MKLLRFKPFPEKPERDLEGKRLITIRETKMWGANLNRDVTFAKYTLFDLAYSCSQNQSVPTVYVKNRLNQTFQVTTESFKNLYIEA